MAKIITDYNIEFSHIYADENLGAEQLWGVNELKALLQKPPFYNQKVVTVVLIDDFHPDVFQFDEAKLRNEFEKLSVAPDFIGYESRLSPVADQLILEIPRSQLANEYFHEPERSVTLLIQDKKRFGLRDEFEFAHDYTCALLSAAWLLCRLGMYPAPEGVFREASDADFAAREIITILPQKYREVEERALDIIGATKFKDLKKHIRHIFF